MLINISAPIGKEKLPLELASILLVVPDPELRATRRLLLNSLHRPVLAVGGYRDVSNLPRDSNCCLVAIDLRPSEHEARRVAMHVRSSWPKARILLFGRPSLDFDDPLYDESVDFEWMPAVVIETARKLLERNDGFR